MLALSYLPSLPPRSKANIRKLLRASRQSNTGNRPWSKQHRFGKISGKGSESQERGKETDQNGDREEKMNDEDVDVDVDEDGDEDEDEDDR